MTLATDEAAVKGWWAGRVAHTKEWLGKNWPHFVTWVALGWNVITTFFKAHGL